MLTIDPPHERKCIAYFLLRVTFGIVFFVYGLDKLGSGRAAVAESLVGMFAKSAMPAGLVRAFGNMLPFVETVLGGAVLLGVLTVPALVCTALLLIALTFGVTLINQSQIVADNLIFALICFVLLFGAEYNRFALEVLWKKK